MLSLSNDNIDLGNIRKGEPISFAVRINNNSNSPVLVDSLIAGCPSCTSAGLVGNPVDNNVPSTLNVTFKPHSKGLNIKTVQLKYKEGKEEKTLKLTFRAEVHEDLLQGEHTPIL